MMILDDISYEEEKMIASSHQICCNHSPAYRRAAAFRWHSCYAAVLSAWCLRFLSLPCREPSKHNIVYQVWAGGWALDGREFESRHGIYLSNKLAESFLLPFYLRVM